MGGRAGSLRLVGEKRQCRRVLIIHGVLDPV